MSSPAERSTRIQIDERLIVDFDCREVLVNGEPVKLRPTEYRLLHYFVQNPGQVLTHEQLLSKVWGPEYVDDNQLLRLYVTYLRQKIELDPSKPRYIFNERGCGVSICRLPETRVRLEVLRRTMRRLTQPVTRVRIQRSGKSGKWTSMR